MSICANCASAMPTWPASWPPPERWPACRAMRPRPSQAFAGDPEGTPAEREAFHLSRLNFLALMFCLMAGTAGLPHLLIRYCTTPTVADSRTSVAWSLVFIALLYLSAPALAVLV